MTAVMGSTEAAMAVAKEAMDRVARSPYVSAVPGGPQQSFPIPALQAALSVSVVEHSRLVMLGRLPRASAGLFALSRLLAQLGLRSPGCQGADRNFRKPGGGNFRFHGRSNPPDADPPRRRTKP